MSKEVTNHDCRCDSVNWDDLAEQVKAAWRKERFGIVAVDGPKMAHASVSVVVGKLHEGPDVPITRGDLLSLIVDMAEFLRNDPLHSIPHCKEDGCFICPLLKRVDRVVVKRS